MGTGTMTHLHFKALNNNMQNKEKNVLGAIIPTLTRHLTSNTFSFPAIDMA